MAKSTNKFDGWIGPLLFFTMVSVVFLAFGVFHTIRAVRNLALVSKYQAKSREIKNVEYKCDNDKTISAIYWNGKVELSLANGKSFLLIQAMSASGVRYTNSDESVTFWNKGNTAFLEQRSITTYNNCSQTSRN